MDWILADYTKELLLNLLGLIIASRWYEKSPEFLEMHPKVK